MKISKIKINNNDYYVVIDVEYKKSKIIFHVYTLKIIKMIIGMEGTVLF